MIGVYPRRIFSIDSFNMTIHVTLQQDMVEKQQQFSGKLQELCDDLTQTENRLIGHHQQTQTIATNNMEDLQQYRQEQQVESPLFQRREFLQK